MYLALGEHVLTGSYSRIVNTKNCILIFIVFDLESLMLELKHVLESQQFRVLGES